MLSLPLWTRVLLWVAGAEPIELLLPRTSRPLYLARMAHEEREVKLSWIEGDKQCPTCGSPGIDLIGIADSRVQKFFAEIATEMRRPSFGEMQSGFMRALLLRAQEAKLYNPSENA